jgi:hypothetical protein
MPKNIVPEDSMFREGMPKEPPAVAPEPAVKPGATIVDSPKAMREAAPSSGTKESFDGTAAAAVYFQCTKCWVVHYGKKHVGYVCEACFTQPAPLPVAG